MNRIDSSEGLRRAIRDQVCTHCYQRPPHSEVLDASMPRACEEGCTIFSNLAGLRKISASGEGEQLGGCEHAMREVICAHCQASPTAGDYCTERLNRTCPLSRYIGRVLEIIEKMSRSKQAQERPAA